MGLETQEGLCQKRRNNDLTEKSLKYQGENNWGGILRVNIFKVAQKLPLLV